MQQQVNTWHTCLLHVMWQARCGHGNLVLLELWWQQEAVILCRHIVMVVILVDSYVVMVSGDRTTSSTDGSGCCTYQQYLHITRLLWPHVACYVKCKRQVCHVFTCCCIATETYGIVLLQIGYQCLQHVGGFHGRLPLRITAVFHESRETLLNAFLNSVLSVCCG
jgi:hypothetical protein